MSSESHPPCVNCSAAAVGETPHGPMCEACAEKRQHAARRIPCSVRYTRNCDLWATGVDEHGEQVCGGCTRKRERLAQPKPKRGGGSRGAPARVRRRVLNRDEYRCQLRYEGVCIGHASQVDHIVNVAASLRAGGTKQQADSEANCQAVCVPCHKQKTERERVAALRASTQRRTARRRLPEQEHPGSWRATSQLAPRRRLAIQ
jgi:5-methylcytosine-specific restriction endonuclease McrA